MVQKLNLQTEITVILINYNQSKYLRDAIKSVLNQSYKNWKLIIVDDFSDKKTRSLLKKISRNKNIKVYFMKKNRGAGFCRNFAIKKSKASYLAFIDSDDIWKKDKLKNQIKFIKKNNLLFSYTNYETFGLKKRKVKNPPKINYLSFLRNTSIATSTMMVKRSLIGKTKFTDTKICEDYYFKCKLLTKTKYAYCLNQYLTKYRIRENSLQSSNLRNFYWIWKINKNYNKLNIFENLISLLFISINSLKKYRGKNFF